MIEFLYAALVRWYRRNFGGPRHLRDYHFEEGIKVATLKETTEEYVRAFGDPIKPGHEFDGTTFNSWRR